jgi:hypothetical protein
MNASENATIILSCAPGISVSSATYGGNCAAPDGDATQQLAVSCNGKTDCDFQVNADRLGDPAVGCDKDFAVTYTCPPGRETRYRKLSGKADGKTLSLTCRPGISVESATYGANCGVPVGNVTRELAASCNGRDRCDYSVDTDQLGDPATGCDKDFAVSYFCSARRATRYIRLPPKSDGETLVLSCASGP